MVINPEKGLVMKMVASAFALLVLATAFSAPSAARAQGTPERWGVAPSLIIAATNSTTATTSAGWYTAKQAARGAKAYKQRCATCHGGNLEGGMGPELAGKQFWLAYGGKKVSTLWSAVHTQMPMTAPGSVSAKDSTDIMAYLLEKNGVPPGTVPLNDTTDLSKALPGK